MPIHTTNPPAAATYTVGSGGDFSTFAAYKARTNYLKNDETVTILSDLTESIDLSGMAGTLTIQGNNYKILEGVTWLDNALPFSADSSAGTGTITLTNNPAETSNVNDLKVEGATTNPDFTGYAGYTVRIRNDAGTIADYTVSSIQGAANNIFRLSATAPTVGDDGSTITILPAISIADNSADFLIYHVLPGITLYLKGLHINNTKASGTSRAYRGNNGAVVVANCVFESTEHAFDCALNHYAAIISPCAFFPGTGGNGVTVHKSSVVLIGSGAVSIGGAVGFLAEASNITKTAEALAVAAVGCSSYGLDFVFMSSALLDGFYARDCTTFGFRASEGSYIYALSTAALASGNGANYSPTVTDTEGNSGARIVFS